MPRRVRLPEADELFRPTVVPPADTQDPADDLAAGPAGDAAADPAAGPTGGASGSADQRGGRGSRSPSGRVRHDEKMTVYVTADELLDLEHARLSLRRSGLGVDRGRLVREAIAIALADLEANGDDSVLVHRLSGA